MLVYDINQNLSMGIYLHIEDTRMSVSTYTFREENPFKGDFVLAETDQALSAIDIKHTQILDLESMKALPDWEDYTLWNVVVKDFSSLELSQPINRNSFTMSSKMNREGFINIFSSIVLELIVPHKNIASFADMGIAVTTGKEFPFICNLPCREKDRSLPLEYGMGQALRHKLLPTLHLHGPDTLEHDGIADFFVEVTAGDAPLHQAVTVFLESTCGYLPVQRLEKVMHTASFRFRASDLEPGQRVTLKAGFKYWSSMARKEISVL